MKPLYGTLAIGLSALLFSCQPENPEANAGRPNAPAAPELDLIDDSEALAEFDRVIDPSLLVTVHYVKSDATGTGDGSSWTNAYTDLQTALSNAGSDEQIWVAAGTYTPSADDTSVSFQLRSGVEVYGGFSGSESNLTERNWLINQTILSGDLLGDDDYTQLATATSLKTIPDEAFELVRTNSVNVVKGANNATLDGFVIQGAHSEYGGGMYNDNVSPTINNTLFRYNYANRAGGGMGNFNGASPTVENVVFSRNYGDTGGGMYNEGGSTPVLSKLVFTNNEAINGGGLYNKESDPTLQNSIFYNNYADNGSALYNLDASPTVSHVVMALNPADNNKAVYNNRSSAKLINSLIWGNELYHWGGPSGDGYLYRPGTVTDCEDPFVNSSDPDGADDVWFTADDGLQLKDNAFEVINQGVNLDGLPVRDIMGQSRVLNPDPGAYEYQG